jgi:hypothetical protein
MANFFLPYEADDVTHFKAAKRQGDQGLAESIATRANCRLAADRSRSCSKPQNPREFFRQSIAMRFCREQPVVIISLGMTITFFVLLMAHNSQFYLFAKAITCPVSFFADGVSPVVDRHKLTACRSEVTQVTPNPFCRSRSRTSE